MKITNVFDSVRDGTFEDFIHFYKGNPDEIDENLDLNLLGLALVNDENTNEKIKIIQFLISEGVDMIFVDTKYKRNALHTFYFNVLRPSPEYMLLITELTNEKAHFFRGGMIVSLVWDVHYLPAPFFATCLNI